VSLHPGIDFAALVAAPVLSNDAGPAHATRVAAGDVDDPALRIGHVPGVVYLPALGLQLAGTAIVPLESVFDPWSLAFEVGRDFQGKADAFRSPFEVVDDPREACIVGNFYSRNFFHWITEELIKVVALEASGFHGCYAFGALPPFAVEFLALLGIGPERILGGLDRPVRFARAWYIDPVTARSLTSHPGLFHALRDRLLAGVLQGAAAPAPRRIWLERKLAVNNPGRELLNVDEVHALVARFGFEVVDMGGRPVREQLLLSHSAAALGGPHGAGFVHAMFQPPRSAVIECYSPLFINPGIFDICRLLHHRYSMVVYENCYEGYPHGNRLMVDLGHLELVLQSLD
jgi:hypothetical protein